MGSNAFKNDALAAIGLTAAAALSQAEVGPQPRKRKAARCHDKAKKRRRRMVKESRRRNR